MAGSPEKSNHPREERDARRSEILHAAFDEFAASGYAGASMEKIARRAKASKETLYAWFGPKEQLFNILLEARVQEFAARYDGGSLGPETDPAIVLQTVAEDVLRFMLAIEPLSRAMGAADETVATARRMVGKLVVAERKKFAALLANWRDSGLIAFDDEPLELASLFVAMAQGEWGFRLATGITDRLTDKMIRAHALRVTQLFLRGLAPVRKAR